MRLIFCRVRRRRHVRNRRRVQRPTQGHALVERKLQQDAGADEQPQCLQAGGQDHIRIVHWTQLGYHGRPDRAKDKVQKRKRQSKVRAFLFIFFCFVLLCQTNY